MKITFTKLYGPPQYHVFKVKPHGLKFIEQVRAAFAKLAEADAGKPGGFVYDYNSHALSFVVSFADGYDAPFFEWFAQTMKEK